MALNITNGKKERARKLVISGSEGIGKSTLAAQCPNPLFLDLEGGTDQIDTRRVTDLKTWEAVKAAVDEVIADPTCCRTLVIDTADYAEGLCSRYICQKFHVEGIESIGYGKGYTYLGEEFAGLLGRLNTLIEKGVNVIIIAHAKMRKQELPEEQGAFDRWEMKLSKQVGPLVKEWADAIFFCNYKTFVSTSENGTKKAMGGERVIYTTHHACWDAKNRFGLKDELPLSFNSIASIFPKTEETEQKKETEVIVNELNEEMPTLRDLMRTDHIEESQVQAIVARKGKYPIDTPVDQYSTEFVNEWVIPNWRKIVSLIAKETK